MKLRPHLLIPPLILRLISKVRDHYLLEKEYRDRTVSLPTLVWLWTNGFYSWHKNLFQLNRKNIHRYLSPKAHRSLHPLNAVYSKLIDNKAFLPLIVEHVPSVYIVFVDGLERYRMGISQGDLYSELDNFVTKRGEIAIKPLCESGGCGFQLIPYGSYRDVLQTKTRKRESFIIQEKVIQHHYANTIYPGSVNTIRMVLYRDVHDRTIKLAGASHRFGTNQSKPVDNLSRGGMLTSIDVESGMLGISFMYEGTRSSGRHTTHPDTGVSIQGVVIPEWNKKVSITLELFNSISWFEYGGLDIVFTHDGFVVLEINSMPNVDILQAFSPYLDNEGLKDFFVSKGLKLKVPKIKV